MTANDLEIKLALALLKQQVESLERRAIGRIEALEENVRSLDTDVNAYYGMSQGSVDPVPAWRRLVNAIAADNTVPLYSPLASALEYLKTLALDDMSNDGRRDSLARLVVLCEAQFGDGWQADPDSYHDPSLTWLLACAADENWKGMGCSAARWLRDLTQDGAA